MTTPLILTRIGNASRAIPVRPGGSAIAAANEPGPNAVELDPFLYPPPNSIAINIAVNQPISGIGGVFTPAAALFQLPPNYYGVISTIDLLLDSILISSNVLWSFLINGVPAPGFAPLTILGRNGAASVSKSWAGPLRLVIPKGGTFGVTIVDVDGAAYTAGTSYYGWMFPQKRS
jgi:hypothetical protein